MTTCRHTTALFVLIGADTVTDWLLSEVERDSHGYVLTANDTLTSGRWGGERQPTRSKPAFPGVVAVGDIRSGSVKRVAASVGEGGMAIAFVRKHLQGSS